MFQRAATQVLINLSKLDIRLKHLLQFQFYHDAAQHNTRIQHTRRARNWLSTLSLSSFPPARHPQRYDDITGGWSHRETNESGSQTNLSPAHKQRTDTRRLQRLGSPVRAPPPRYCFTSFSGRLGLVGRPPDRTVSVFTPQVAFLESPAVIRWHRLDKRRQWRGGPG